MSSVLPLVFALASATVDAQEQARRKRGSRRAPEFDPNASGPAVAPLVGGTPVLSERRHRNKSESE
jgi:hypothetical protein